MAFTLGAVLPNFGPHASRDAVAHVAQAAEELGFDSVWVPEHLIVGEDAAAQYGRVLEPLTVLAWVAARTERVKLGTSIILVPLHHPVRLAKEAATLQELSGGRFLLGVGVGWHEPEYRFLGVGFGDRGRRADEALRLMRALWAGERDFRGEYWSFEGGHFAPLPERPPEIWVGGTSRRSLRRARELGDVWHPNDSDPKLVRKAGGLRVVPRVRAGDDGAEKLSALRDAGAEGAVVSFGTEPGEAVAAMERFAREVAPTLGKSESSVAGSG